MNRIIERMFIVKAKDNQPYEDNDRHHDDNNDDDTGGQDGGSSSVGESASQSTEKTANKGTLIIGATCTPADIAFPTDPELCDKARRWTETILDHYWKIFGSADSEKNSRTYRREVARRKYLALAKRRRKSAKKSGKSFAIIWDASTEIWNILMPMRQSTVLTVCTM